MAAGPVQGVLSLGHDAFEAEAAGLLEKRRPFSFDVITEENRRSTPLDERREGGLALYERSPCEVDSIEADEVKDLVDQSRCPPPRESALEQLEVADALLIEGDELSVEDGAPARQLLESRGDLGETGGPVLAAA
jgi:hypothetical protein